MYTDYEYNDDSKNSIRVIIESKENRENRFWNTGFESSQRTETEKPVRNTMDKLTTDVKEELLDHYFETGKSSIAQRYFEKISASIDIVDLMQSIFFYAKSIKNHLLEWNVMVCLSQIEYRQLNDKAAVLAVAATRSENLDVQEIAIMCFENWEDKQACRFLEGMKFEESWLQEYANEVIEYVKEVGQENVLFEKNYAWKMAFRKRDTNSHIA